MEYLGGTYISQVEAADENEAMRVWLRNLPTNEIEGLSKFQQKRLIKIDFEDEEPTLVQGLTNAWCTGFRTKNGYAHVNFVKTDLTF